MENSTSAPSVRVVGGGLAGSEAAYYLAKNGIRTQLVDMKPKKFTPAHHSADFCELVCSNSLKSNDAHSNACGLLKEEMRILGSLVVEAADKTSVPAGAALAVDRDKFAKYVTDKLRACPNLSILEEEVVALPDESTGGIFTTLPRPSSPQTASIWSGRLRGTVTARARAITSIVR